MKTDASLASFIRIRRQWPCGIRVWHRADGRRGVIGGHALLADGQVNLRVDYGAGGWANELPVSVSALKVSDGTDSDDWRDGDEHDGKEGSEG